MTLPSSTYRIQFRNGMTFDRAAALAPYLKSLGISHLYASPIFTATSGSTHGYDVTDANEIDPAIGGRDGFERLCDALKRAGLELILDIVPNHMAASLENAWWRSVLQEGANSPYARHFDIDWNERLTLPQLGKSFDAALDDGEIEIGLDEKHGNLALAYFGSLFPLSSESQSLILPRVAPQRLGSVTLDAAAAEQLKGALAALNSDRDFLREIHNQQHWRLCYWKDASEHLTYRRFFEVAGLVGIRVEDARVFDDTHRLIIDLVRSGKVQGLRIDHIDGLADPKAYLEQLRKHVGTDTYIIVEKILGHGEALPQTWHVAGTTGYEFILGLSHLLIENEGLKKLAAAYFSIDPEAANYTEGLRAAKLLMVTRNFAGEVRRLGRLARHMFPATEETELTSAIREMLIAFPVYRTYGTGGTVSAADMQVLEGVAAKAAQLLEDSRAADLIASVLKGEETSAEAMEFRTRFQQLSGPVMAKAMEDTLFYRHNRLLAMNEVGGEPDEEPGGVTEFHRLMAERAELQPHGLSSTSTHDTKRGEDARARLYALSEGADVFAKAVERWRDMNSSRLTILSEGSAPEPNVEWMLYQALAGIWPEDFERRQADELRERFTAYAEKAIREAKLGTDWAEQNSDYEEAIRAYASALIAPENDVFLEDFSATLQPFIQTGYLNSLSQTLIKLTAPGIPDIYQGAEAFDFSLVDPDNRRSVDYAQLEGWLQDERPIPRLQAPALKQRIIASVLNWRQYHALLFAEGQYLPLEIEGIRREHLVGFARQHGDDFAITIAPRLMFGRLDDGVLFASPEFWEDTSVTLPSFANGLKTELLTGKTMPGGDILSVAALLGDQPLALLVPGGSPAEE